MKHVGSSSALSPRGLRGLPSIALPVMLAIASLGISARALAQSADFATVSTHGEVAASARDARTRALDLAFVAAVREVVEQLVPKAERARLQSKIVEHLERRARLYVASFRVEREADDGTTLGIWIAAKIDRDKVRARLDELGVKWDSGGKATPLAPTAVVGGFLVVASVSQPGSEQDAVAAADQVAALLSERGYPAAHERVEGDDPTGAATARAKERGAAAVIVVRGWREAAKGVRGTRLIGARFVVELSAIDVQSGSVAAKGSASGSGVGADAGAADGLALAEAVREAVSGASSGLAARYVRTAPATLKGHAVVIRGFSRYASVQAVIAALGKTPGVAAVVPQRFARGQISMIVRGSAPLGRLAASVRGVSLPEGALEVSERAGAIMVNVAGEPRI